MGQGRRQEQLQPLPTDPIPLKSPVGLLGSVAAVELLSKEKTDLRENLWRQLE